MCPHLRLLLLCLAESALPNGRIIPRLMLYPLAIPTSYPQMHCSVLYCTRTLQPVTAHLSRPTPPNGLLLAVPLSCWHGSVG
eukprot:1200892-Pyramimonas_sp.AAC.1